MKYKAGDLIYASSSKIYMFITDVTEDVPHRYLFYPLKSPENRSFLFAVDVDNNANFIKVESESQI